MRIDYITAGAAGMLCGTCIRDNALAAELLRQGQEVRVIPLYTPTLTDEENVSQRRVFFSGLNLYLRNRFPAFRRVPGFLDRLGENPRLLRWLSRLAVSAEASELGELTVSVLQGEDGAQRVEFERLLRWMKQQPRPEVVSLPFTLLIRLAEPIKRELGCSVCCTLQGEDLFLEKLPEPYRVQALQLIRTHLDAVDSFVAVSRSHADFMADYLNLPPEKVHVVPLGINLEGYSRAARPPARPFTIGYFARITPEKGLDVLCEAYRILRKEKGLPASRLEAAGYLGHEYKGYLKATESRMQEWGLGGEFRYRGVLSRDEKIRFLQGLDVISVPGPYADPKGLYLLEAMGCGVPFVQPRHGAFPEIRETTDAGVLVEPNSPASLAEGLYTLWNDRERAAELGRNGFEAVRRHYGVAQEAARVLGVYGNLLGRGASEPLKATIAEPA